ncbi:low temperature requirement protein A [Streptomyces sp. NPDC014685]|uniref:low temperature requirement protein A n=1 Tax=Streptomyces sp. NPDC014685 TaxID=3364881 RepID=UPI0036F7DF65
MVRPLQPPQRHRTGSHRPLHRHLHRRPRRPPPDPGFLTRHRAPVSRPTTARKPQPNRTARTRPTRARAAVRPTAPALRILSHRRIVNPCRCRVPPAGRAAGGREQRALLRLFIIIQLGETVLTIGAAISAAPVDAATATVGPGVFVALVCLCASYFRGGEDILARHVATRADSLVPVRRAVSGQYPTPSPWGPNSPSVTPPGPAAQRSASSSPAARSST